MNAIRMVGALKRRRCRTAMPQCWKRLPLWRTACSEVWIISRYFNTDKFVSQNFHVFGNSSDWSALLRQSVPPQGHGAAHGTHCWSDCRQSSGASVNRRIILALVFFPRCFHRFKLRWAVLDDSSFAAQGADQHQSDLVVGPAEGTKIYMAKG